MKDAIIIAGGTHLIEAAKIASDNGMNLYLTRGGTFVAAKKRLSASWISVGVMRSKKDLKDAYEQVDSESWLSQHLGGFAHEAV